MGRYSQAVKNQLDEIRNGLNEPLPDYMNDSSPIPGYIAKQNGLVFKRTEIGNLLLGDIRSLTEQQQEQLYNEILKDEVKERISFDYFKTRLGGAALFNKNYMNLDIGTIAERVEELMGPEKADEAAVKIENTVAPNEPQYPIERKVYQPYTQELNALEQAIEPKDPDAQRKRELIKKASDRLLSVRNEYLDYLNQSDKATGEKKTGFSHYMSNIFDQENEDFFAGYENGKLLNKLPTTQSFQSGKPRIDMIDMGPKGNGKLNDEEVREFMNIKPSYGEEIKEKVDEYFSLMDQVGVENYKNSKTAVLKDGKVVFKGEQGLKMYGFWPLATVKSNLAMAVKNGDYAEMERLCNEYDRIDDLTGKMVDIAHTGSGAFIGGNVNSTRPEFSWLNPIPLKYAEDYVGQNRINGMFEFYAFTKNTGKTAREVLDDPTKIATETADAFITQNSFGRCKTLGAKLFHARCEGESARFGFDWTSQLSLLERGMTGVAGLASTKEDRKNVIGALSCAIGSAGQLINTEVAAWNKMNNPPDAYSDALYAQTVLLPEDEVDVGAIGRKMLKNNWQQELSVENTVSRLRQEGRLDYGAMVDRADRIIAEAVAEQSRYANNEGNNISKFSVTEYKLAASKAMKRAMSAATPEERETEGFRRLRAKAVQFHNEAMSKKLAVAMKGIDEIFVDYDNAGFNNLPEDGFDPIEKLRRELQIQMQEKKGFFLSSTNSDEHQRMVFEQQKLYLKLKYLRGDPFPEGLSENARNYIVNADIGRIANEARRATFEYCSKKTDYGKSDSFMHQVGTTRYNSSIRSLNTIDKLITRMDLVNPGERKRRAIQNTVFDHRNDRDWLDQNIEEKAAQMLYACALVHKKLPENEMNERLLEQNMRQGVETVRNSPAFQRLIASNDHQRLGEIIAKGHSSLTDAFIKASNEVADNRNAPAPARMTDDQKREFMKDNIIPVLQ